VGVNVPASAVFDANDSATLRILCPARLHPMKGHQDLLEALVRLRDAGVPFECDLAGDGPLRASIETAVREMNLGDYVRLRGAVPHDVLLEDISKGAYDVVALASIEDEAVTWIFEGIPVALVEAMAAGLPCVSTRVGSIPELVDEESGILVEQHDPHGLADALTRLADAELRTRLGTAARKRALDGFDVRNTAAALFQLISADSYPLVERTAHVASPGNQSA
jgi:glycosyltransferase involved in cell wall biosynthesis